MNDRSAVEVMLSWHIVGEDWQALTRKILQEYVPPEDARWFERNWGTPALYRYNSTRWLFPDAAGPPILLQLEESACNVADALERSFGIAAICDLLYIGCSVCDRDRFLIH